MHWYLVLDSGSDGIAPHIIDPTASQFREPPPYHRGSGRGFLTKKPSKRARALMEQMLWQGIPAGRRRVTPR